MVVNYCDIMIGKVGSRESCIRTVGIQEVGRFLFLDFYGWYPGSWTSLSKPERLSSRKLCVAFIHLNITYLGENEISRRLVTLKLYG